MEKRSRLIAILSGVLSDVIEDGRVPSVGDHGSPVGWLAQDSRWEHNILTVEMQPANIILCMTEWNIILCNSIIS